MSGRNRACAGWCNPPARMPEPQNLIAMALPPSADAAPSLTAPGGAPAWTLRLVYYAPTALTDGSPTLAPGPAPKADGPERARGSGADLGALARLEPQALGAGARPHGLGEARGVLQQHGERLVVDGHHDLGGDRLDGVHRVLRPHGVVVAYRQQREVDAQRADPGHVGEVGRVARVVDAHAVGL